MAITLAKPISAHKVEVAEDVGATLHIEPNDIPKAGEPTKVWFALTKIGGTVIPLSKCDCELVIYDQKRSPISNINPVLKPLSTEGYQNIPSADVTFPKIGRYNLEITGQPQNGENFKPFKLNFKVTITTVMPQVFPTIPNPNSGFKAVNPDSDIQAHENQLIPILTSFGIIAIASVILIFRINKKEK